MADKKISELDPANTLDGTEEVPVVQNISSTLTTVRTTTAALAKMAAGSVTIPADLNNQYYVRTAAASCTITNGNPGIVTAASHGLNDGDTVAISVKRQWVNCTISNGTPALITATAHGLAAGDPVSFISTNGTLNTGISAPAFMASGTGIYYVTNNGALTADAFNVSDTRSHALAGTNTVNTSSAGSGQQAFFRTGRTPTNISEGQVYYVVNKTASTFQMSATSGGTAIDTTGTQDGYFVFQTGNDATGDGTAQTASKAFMTIQAAANYFSRNTWGIGAAFVNLSDGTYNEQVVLGSLNGGGDFNYANGGIVGIAGNPSHPENVLLRNDGVNYYGIVFGGVMNAFGSGYWSVSNVTAEAETSSVGAFGLFNCMGNNAHLAVNAYFGSNLSGPHIKCGAGSGYQARVTCSGGRITGTADSFCNVDTWGYGDLSHGTLTFCVNPNYSYFIVGQRGGRFVLEIDQTLTNSGVYTGPQYSLDSGAFLIVEQTVPGTAATSVINEAWFIDKTTTTSFANKIGYRDNTGGAAVTVRAQASTGAWTLQWPTSAGTNGYALTTNGSGVCSWTNVTGSASAGGSNDQIQWNNAGTLDGFGTVKASIHITGAGVTALGDVTTGDYNTALGYNTGRGITTGSNNTVIGARVGSLGATLASNIIVADGSGSVCGWIDNSSSNFNTVWGGGSAGHFGTITGTRTVAIGWAAGAALTTGSYNVLIGVQAGTALTDGHDNFFLGFGAGVASVHGYSNVGIGSNCFTALAGGNGNVAIGESSLQAITTGYDNVGIGRSVSTAAAGTQNVVIGATAGASGPTDNNVLIGFQAGYFTTGNLNVSVGKRAGVSVSSGADNTCIGSDSGNSITTGSYNTVIGANVDIGSNQSNWVLLGDGQGNIRFKHDGTDIFLKNSANFAARFMTTITGGGTTNAPTLNTGPVNGDPTKWIPVDDNGTTRYIPSW